MKKIYLVIAMAMIGCKADKVDYVKPTKSSGYLILNKPAFGNKNEVEEAWLDKMRKDGWILVEYRYHASKYVFHKEMEGTNEPAGQNSE